MSTRIDRRDDVNPERGEHEYGDVEFADPVNKKYPIDNAGHVRAAWSYINQRTTRPDTTGMKSRQSRAGLSRRPRSTTSRSTTTAPDRLYQRGWQLATGLSADLSCWTSVADHCSLRVENLRIPIAPGRA